MNFTRLLVVVESLLIAEITIHKIELQIHTLLTYLADLEVWSLSWFLQHFVLNNSILVAYLGQHIIGFS